MKRIFLTSIGNKILSTLCSFGMFFLTYESIFLVDKINIIAILFTSFVTIFFLFYMYLSYNHRVCLKNNKLILKQIKTDIINIEDIKFIHIEEYSFIKVNSILIETNQKTYRLNGYNSLLKKKNKLKTKNIVIKLCENINVPFKE